MESQMMSELSPEILKDDDLLRVFKNIYNLIPPTLSEDAHAACVNILSLAITCTSGCIISRTVRKNREAAANSRRKKE